MGSLDVTVAVLAPFVPVFEVDGYETTEAAKWEDLPKVRLTADPAESLRAVLRRACEAAGVRVTRELLDAEGHGEVALDRAEWFAHTADKLVFVAFRRPDDDLPVEEYPAGFLRRETRRYGTLAVVRDAEGRALWRRPGLDASMAELLDAASNGLLAGDPLQPYLIPSIPQGDLGGLDQWINLKDALSVLVTIASVDGLLGLKDRIVEVRKRRGAALVAAVERNSSDWSQRGAAPSDLVRLLAARDRNSGEVAALLGCPETEAEALLWGLGFAYDDSRAVWVHKGDEIARLLADDVALTFADVVSVLGDVEALRKLAAERLEYLATTGEAPTLESANRALDERMGQELDDLGVGLGGRLARACRQGLEWARRLIRRR